MNKNRRTQKRSLRFEALEGRFTLSTGLTTASSYAHAMVMSRIQRTIPFNFRGHTSTSGATLTIPDLAGTIGNVRFTGYGSATTSGIQVVGGDAYLTSKQGGLHLKFETGSFTQVARRQRQSVPFVIVEATGKYSSYVGATGMGTTWSVPANPKRISTFSGVLDLA
jgi:hypothetical protein